MDISLHGKCVKIIDDKEKINKTQKLNKLNPIDFEKYHNKIGHVYSVKEEEIKVQYYINDITEHILIHKSLLQICDNYSKSCETAQTATEIKSKVVKSEKSVKSGSNPSSMEIIIRQNSNTANANCERILDKIISAITDPNITDIKHLCKNSVHINDKGLRKQTALHCAAYFGKVNHMKTLLEYGCELNAIDDDGDTAVHLAIYNEQYDSVVFLIDKNPQFLQTKNYKGEIPLLIAAKKKNDKLFLFLLKKNDKLVNEKDTDGNVCLHYIVKNNNVDLVKKLLSNKNLNIHLLNNDKLPPYYYACSLGHKEIIECFIKYCKEKKETPIVNKFIFNESSHQILIRHKHYIIAKWLIKEHPISWSQNPISTRHGTILHSAVFHLQLEIVRSLIHLDPDIIELNNSNGETALDIALQKYNPNSDNNIQGRNIAKLLIDKGTVKIMSINKNILNHLLNSSTRQ